MNATGMSMPTRAKVTAPAKQSAKATSVIAAIGTAAANAAKSIATGVQNIAKSMSTAAEAAKKKAAAEAAAKNKVVNTSAATQNAARIGTKVSSKGSSTKPDLIRWDRSRFYVTPSAVRSYKGMQISTSCGTEDEENGEDKYLKKKNNGIYEVKLTAVLDKRLGEADVRREALRLAESARTGAADYVYCSGSKLFTPQMMGTGASVKNIVVAPNGTWVSCEVDLTLKQCSKGDGGTAPAAAPSGGSSGGASNSPQEVVKTAAQKTATAIATGVANLAKALAPVAKAAKDAAEKTTQNAKDASAYVKDKIDSVKPASTSIPKVTTTRTPKINARPQ